MSGKQLAPIDQIVPPVAHPWKATAANKAYRRRYGLYRSGYTILFHTPPLFRQTRQRRSLSNSPCNKLMVHCSHGLIRRHVLTEHHCYRSNNTLMLCGCVGVNVRWRAAGPSAIFKRAVHKLLPLAGVGQQTATAGAGQQTATAGLGQRTATAGLGQQYATAGVGQQTATAGVGQAWGNKLPPPRAWANKLPPKRKESPNRRPSSPAGAN